VTADTRRGIEFFDVETAVHLDDTVMQRPPTLDQAARDALPEFRSGKGSVTKMLFGDPGKDDDGGMSLVWVRFAAHYPLPRHSHSVDCVYYIVSGEIHMGSRVLRAGSGFFVAADAPYGYTAGPEGVEVLEFRAKSGFDSVVRESPAGWQRILEGVRAHRDQWAAADS
jgi:mannose-6-phosphate isomerase-like protein (cupin superfamily)